MCTEDHFAHPRSANGSLNPINTIRGVLRKYHEVNKNVEGALFFGLLIKTKDGSLKIRAHRGFSSTKEQIDTLWEQIIDAIKREKIDWE